MNVSALSLTRGAAWSIGSYAAAILFRFCSNIILARLLAPDLFGVMLIITSLRVGMELITDVGVGQSVIQNPKGDQPDFYNTAWTIQLVRGFLLAAVFFAGAGPVADLYGIPRWALQTTALVMIATGATSTSIFLNVRNMNYAARNIYDVVTDCLGIVCFVVLALITPTLSALVWATVLSFLIKTGFSFFLPHARQELKLVPGYAGEIIHFGKWIFLSSIVNFAAMNFDRLYLGASASLAALGVFGLARTIAELPVMLSQRLNNSLTFPAIANAAGLPRETVRANLAQHRSRYLAIAAVSMAAAVSFSDYFISLLYDNRYQDAAWMLPLLLFGAWGALLTSLNEYTLLGLGQPKYTAFGNMLKLAYLAAALPLGVHFAGMLGAVFAVATCEIFRYAPIVIGQMREKFAYRVQDMNSTLLFVGLIIVFSLVRWALGFGVSFQSVPLSFLHHNV